MSSGPGEPPIAPRVSIGVPVYNGEKYLAEALRSLLNQTFSDIEICISDNASTDRTEEICREFARQDPRIRYARASSNHGLVWNHRRVLAMARGRYFMYAPHDDWFAPEYVDRCVEILESRPDVAYVYAETLIVDESGMEVGRELARQRLQDPSPSLRFWDVLTVQGGINWYGLTRRSLLDQIGRYEAVPRSERIVLGELALWGPFEVLPTRLYFRRIHDGQATATRRIRQNELRVLDPSKAHGWRRTTVGMLAEYVWLWGAAIARPPLSLGERARAYVRFGHWLIAHVPLFRLRDPRTTNVAIERTGVAQLPEGRTNIGY